MSYRLGEELINACKFWWCGGLLYFVLRIPSIRAEVRQHKQSIKPDVLQKSLQEVKNQCNALRNTRILIRRTLCDSKGVDFLNLCLQNASVPHRYYFIFYKMPYQKLLCNHSPICIDAGAHKGVVTDMILQCGGISYAFEPNCYLAEFLRNKYQGNPNVILYQNAVSDRNYTTQFLEYSLLSDGNRIVGGDTSKKTYDVEVLDLTEVILEILSQYSKIYFLKLDIEGAEFEIIDKIITLGLWKKIDYIACETHERFFVDGEQKMQNLKRKIEENRIENILLDWA